MTRQRLLQSCPPGITEVMLRQRVIIHCVPERLAGDERRELRHEPGAGAEPAVAERLVEGEVAEDLDQLGSVTLAGRDVVGEQPAVVLLGVS